MGGWAVGNTKVFLRQEPMNRLNAARVRLQNESATKLQAAWKCRACQAKYVACRLRFIRFQARWRGYVGRQHAKELRRQLHMKRTQAADEAKKKREDEAKGLVQR